jgi:hypothetical protein
MKVASFKRRGVVPAGRAVLRYTVDLCGGTMRVEADRRLGRTARWPASLLPMRFGGHRRGVWLRLGDRAWWFVFVHSSRPYRYLEPAA